MITLVLGLFPEMTNLWNNQFLLYWWIFDVDMSSVKWVKALSSLRICDKQLSSKDATKVVRNLCQYIMCNTQIYTWMFLVSRAA